MKKMGGNDEILEENVYICTQKGAKSGGTSAIDASIIAFGLH